MNTIESLSSIHSIKCRDTCENNDIHMLLNILKILLSQQVITIKVTSIFSFVSKSFKVSVYFYTYSINSVWTGHSRVITSHLWVSGVVVEGASLCCNILVIISVLGFLSYSYHQEPCKANSSVFLILSDH